MHIRIIACIAAALLLVLANAPAHGKENEGETTRTLRSGWTLQSSAKVPQTGEALSSPDFHPSGWYPITAPASVLAGLLQNHVYPDPFYGDNLRRIDPSAFDVPWWYRTTFSLPAASGRHVWLKLEGVNYRADIWLNGTRLADTDTAVGPFRTFEFDITDKVRASGPNALAIQVFRPTDPTKKDLAITFVDWNPNPPDANMGILGDVVVSTSGPVRIRHPFVATKFDLPSLKVAHLTVEAEVTNGSAQPITGSLEGSIGRVSFARKVTLPGNTTQRVAFTSADYPRLNLPDPAIWWPWQYGDPALNTLTLKFTVAGQVSDRLGASFGIRQITSTVDANGCRVFSVNGKPIQIRGGAWTPDMFQRRDPARQEAEVRYARDLHLNTLRFEGKMEDDNLFTLTDRYGLLVMIGWNCCDAWQASPSWDESRTAIAMDSLKSLMYRFRNHPSMLAWLNGSDEAAAPPVERRYLEIERDLGWPNPILSSAASTATDAGGPTGVKMNGPYEWVPPIYWETDAKHRRGGAWNFSTEISPGPAVPPYESLVRFLPPDHLWPRDDIWSYHAGGKRPFNDLTIFSDALEARYGAATDARDYARKAQIAAYESHRAMMEAYGRNKYVASGVIQWMMGNAWPSMIWHLYDYYLRPGGSYYGVKNALEPLHVQYSYADGAIVVLNGTAKAVSGLKVSAAVYNLDGTRKYANSAALSHIDADAVAAAFTLPSLPGLTTTYFLRLTLTDAGGQVVSLQTYWLSTRPDVLDWDRSEWYYTPTTAYADFTALSTLPPVKLTVTDHTVRKGARSERTLRITNPTSAIAFGVHLRITKGKGGEEVLPILWQDNYLVLLPGETRTITATYETAALSGAAPILAIDGWNARPFTAGQAGQTP